MGSSSGTNSKSPSTPNPQGSTVTKYGNATPFNPSWVSFLPDNVDAGTGRMPMATGLDESHLAAIRDRAPPPELSAKPKDAMGGDLKTQFAQMMADYEKEKKLNAMKAAFISGINPGLRRGGSGGMADHGGYTSTEGYRG